MRCHEWRERFRLIDLLIGTLLIANGEQRTSGLTPGTSKFARAPESQTPKVNSYPNSNAAESYETSIFFRGKTYRFDKSLS